MFDEENLISLTIFLSFCLSVHNTYVQPWLWGYVFFAKIVVFFRIIFNFFAKFSRFFSRIFRIIFFSRNFRIIFFREIFAFFYFAKISHFLFRENFRIFRERTKCENEAKFSRKMRNFCETIFPYRWKPYSKYTNFNWKFLKIKIQIWLA